MASVATFREVHTLLRAQRAASFTPTTTTSSTPLSPSAVYGFAVWLSSFFLLAVFLVWSWSPLSLSLSVFPSRYWSIALPTWLCVSLALVPVAYRLLCLALLPMPPQPALPRTPPPPPPLGCGVPPLTVLE